MIHFRVRLVKAFALLLSEPHSSDSQPGERFAMHPHATTVKSFMAKVDLSTTPTGCWIWTGAFNTSGYGKLKSKSKVVTAHVYSYQSFVGPVPKGLCVLHHCDNPKCVRPDHLFVGTKQANVADMVAKGRQAKGEKQHLAKLTEASVLEIRRLHLEGVDSLELAQRFSVTRNGIDRVLKRITWKHIH